MSAIALLKIVMHASSKIPKDGSPAFEVMGLMQGYVEDETFIVTDSFALPIEGTETRVVSTTESAVFIAKYVEDTEKLGRVTTLILFLKFF